MGWDSFNERCRIRDLSIEMDCIRFNNPSYCTKDGLPLKEVGFDKRYSRPQTSYQVCPNDFSFYQIDYIFPSNTTELKMKVRSLGEFSLEKMQTLIELRDFNWNKKEIISLLRKKGTPERMLTDFILDLQ